MSDNVITEELRHFLEKREFIYVATCSPDGQPHVAPKFLIRVDRDFIYLADFVMGKMWENLKGNPKVSLSAMNLDELMGYQIRGLARIIDKGAEFDEAVNHLHKRELRFSVDRIIEGVRKDKRHKNFEVAFPKRLVVVRVEVEEVVDIAPSGQVHKRQRPAK